MIVRQTESEETFGENENVLFAQTIVYLIGKIC